MRIARTTLNEEDGGGTVFWRLRSLVQMSFYDVRFVGVVSDNVSADIPTASYLQILPSVVV